jgi:hypothetical protein
MTFVVSALVTVDVRFVRIVIVLSALLALR